MALRGWERELLVWGILLCISQNFIFCLIIAYHNVCTYVFLLFVTSFAWDRSHALQVDLTCQKMGALSPAAVVGTELGAGVCHGHHALSPKKQQDCSTTHLWAEAPKYLPSKVNWKHWDPQQPGV